MVWPMAVHPTREDILPLAIINIVINCHYINIPTIGLMSIPQDGQLTQVLTEFGANESRSTNAPSRLRGVRGVRNERVNQKKLHSNDQVKPSKGRIGKHLIVGTIQGSAITSELFVSPSDNTLPALMSLTHRDFGNVTTIRWQRSSKNGQRQVKSIGTT